jgi:hypothetical protein
VEKGNKVRSNIFVTIDILADWGKKNSRRGAEAQRVTENEIGTVVVESALAVHLQLGPGLLETVYEVVLVRELQDRGLKVERQVSVPIEYRGDQVRRRLSGRLNRRRQGYSGIEIYRTSDGCAQETDPDVFAAYRMQTWLPAEFWRGLDEIRNYPMCYRP